MSSSPLECRAELPPDQPYGTLKNAHPSFGWPDACGCRVAVAWGSGVLLLWLLIYGGANWITGLHGYRASLQTQLDSMLPFLPAAVIVYLSLFPMLWLSPLVLRSPDQLRLFARALAIVIVTSGVGLILVPAEPIDAHPTETHAFRTAFQFADRLNLTHNYFPSLHVAMAMTCAVCYGRLVAPHVAIVFWLWAGAIALATLLTRQHYVVDVLVGGALGAAVAIRFANSPLDALPPEQDAPR
jgi:membrane-associated phospholipid phosphatase